MSEPFGVLTCPHCSGQMAVPQGLPAVGMSQVYGDKFDRVIENMRRRAKMYRRTEAQIASVEQTNLTRQSREFFRGAAEAMEWTLAEFAGDRFDWLGGEN